MDYPRTPRDRVVDEYHGVTVEDPYRWLEDAGDSRVREWIQAQNENARAYLDHIPFRSKIYEEIKRLRSDSSPEYTGLSYCGKRLFALKRQPPLQQPLLVWLASADDPASERVVLDPNQLDPGGGTAIDFFVPSHDGRLVAVSLSKGGSEAGDLYFYDADSGAALEDRLPRVNYPTAGGSAAWNGDASGVYYTRYPRGEERPPEDRDFYQQVFFHLLGTSPEQDTYVIGADFSRIAEIDLESSKDGRYVLALVENGDGGEAAHYLRGPRGEWTQVTRFEDQAQKAAIGRDGYLYLLSHQNAPRGKLLRLPLGHPVLSEAETVLPQLDGVISSFLPTDTCLYIALVEGGPSRLLVFDRQGQLAGEAPLEPVSAISEWAALDGDEMLYNSTSYLTPPAWYRYDPRSNRAQRTSLFVISPADFSDLEVAREFAVSRDGTRVPVNVIHKKGLLLDGKNPTLLTGYGGYGINNEPGFVARNRVWFDAGGIFAVANLRGGGEYGEAWHRAGNLENKQNVFDDFIACAEHLIQRGYTSAEKLSILGGSNGGLLMGAVLTQRPDLFGAVVSMVGIYDMLRVELDPNGAFNVTEYGTVKNPRQFEVLYSYSPYHHVTDGAAYPPVLFTTGENDGRVNPAHSRKMAARMQAATSSGKPVLLLTNRNAGHGMGMSMEQRNQLDTDIFAFLMAQLGMQPGSRGTASASMTRRP